MAELIKGAPTKPYLLIDGDIFLYRCGFAVEKTKYCVTAENLSYDGALADFYESAKEAKDALKDYPEHAKATVWSRREVEPVENALEATRKALSDVCTSFWPGDTWKGQIYLTGKGNFRERIEAVREYKDNRDPAHRPKHYHAIRRYLVDKWGARIVNGMEADDAIGIDAYSRPVDGYVVVSNDKDLDQISGFHYDWTTKKFYYVNDEESLKVFYRQLLCGDTTDNIKGVVSEAKAAKLIDEADSPKRCAEIAKEEYEKVYGEYWADKLEATAELVWIRKVEKEPDEALYNPFWRHLDD